MLSLLLAAPCCGEGASKSEIEMQAERMGIKIETLTNAVKQGIPGALSVYLALGIDGGGGEIFHEYDRPALLRTLSDEKLAETLVDFSATKISRIERELTFDLKPEELEALKKRFPLTFKVIDESNKRNKTEMATPRKPSD